MKVVQVLYSGLGGHGSVAFSLGQAAAAEGAWTNAMAFVGIEPMLEEYESLCRAAGIPCAYVGTTPGRAWHAWPAVYSALDRLRPDAIVLHSVKTILPCALYARRHRIPLVAVEHQPNGLKSRSEWWVSRLLMRLADRVVMLTDDYAAQLQARLGGAWRRDKVCIIPNGIDTDVFCPRARAPAGAGPRVIGMAARFTSTKRQDLLVDALALLRAQDGPAAWRLTLAGDGETLPALREKVRAMQLQDSVEFPGYLGEQALHAWFSSLHVYAQASAGETLSTSLLQALAMGLPIVGSNVPGIGNLLAAGGGCGVAVGQSAEAFAQAFRRLADAAVLADDLRQRARTLAVSEFSQAAMFRRYETVLRQLCAR